MCWTFLWYLNDVNDFLIFIVFVTSLAAGLCQNGVFAFVSGFGQPRYTQAIMTGQGVAGVLPWDWEDIATGPCPAGC